MGWKKPIGNYKGNVGQRGRIRPIVPAGVASPACPRPLYTKHVTNGEYRRRTRSLSTSVRNRPIQEAACLFRNIASAEVELSHYRALCADIYNPPKETGKDWQNKLDRARVLMLAWRQATQVTGNFLPGIGCRTDLIGAYRPTRADALVPSNVRNRQA